MLLHYQACDEALSTVHESYEAKLGKVKEDLRAQLQLKNEALEAAKIKILDIEVPATRLMPCNCGNLNFLVVH